METFAAVFRSKLPTSCCCLLHRIALVLLVVSTIGSRFVLSEKFPLLMPNVRPQKDESYLCTPVRIDFTRKYYIVGFEPHASMHVAHHMLIYGCTTPGSNDPIWNCGEMANQEEELHAGSPCEKGSQIIYAWGRDAPALELPGGVAFSVGADSPIQYLVLQVHYAHVDKFKDGSTDDSGVYIHYTETPQPRSAGVILFGTNGMIAAGAEEHLEVVCEIQEEKTIHPFAFRTHTHQLGRVVSAYLVQKDAMDNDHWTLIGKEDPQKPQMFYPVHNNVTIEIGDQVAARCTMVSDRDHITYIGATAQDEMCNFYLMYWVDGDRPLEQKFCISMGAPYYYWKQELNNIPDEDASTLP